MNRSLITSGRTCVAAWRTWLGPLSRLLLLPLSRSCAGWACALLLWSSAASADAAFQLALPGVQAPTDPNVNGIRFVLFAGENDSVQGVDLGLAAVARAGAQSGFTLNLGVSIVEGPSSGSPWALINVHQGPDQGLNVAFVNSVRDVAGGANLGFVNVTQGTSAVDVGGLSVSERSRTQVGFVNVTRQLEGVQIGFLNFAENGFLPVFPFFNMPRE